jgi:catechol 2,3-dioxygenase-like lactoylglutathione lyase family enzyme
MTISRPGRRHEPSDPARRGASAYPAPPREIIVNIMRLEALTYGVEDLDASKRYYDDWGLTATEHGHHGVDYVLPSGQTIRLRAFDDRSLPAPVEAGSTIREVTWGVDDAASMEAVGSVLSRDRDPVSSDGTLRTFDPWGMGVAFTIAKPGFTSAYSVERARNEPFAVRARILPWRIGHVVLNVPAAKIRQTSEFYLDRLQFRLTDRVTEFGDFLRCAGSSDHHNLFLLQKPDGGLNHVAFEVENFDEVVVGGKFMEERGWEAATTLGRHIMGSNVFWYFKNPGGGLAEYFADMDVMDDDWKPRIWETNPGFSRWMM